MKPDGTLTVDEIMKFVDDLQYWEKQELAERMGFFQNDDDDDNDRKIEYAEDAVEHFGTAELLEEIGDNAIIDYLEDNGYEVIEK